MELFDCSRSGKESSWVPVLLMKKTSSVLLKDVPAVHVSISRLRNANMFNTLGVYGKMIFIFLHNFIICISARSIN